MFEAKLFVEHNKGTIDRLRQHIDDPKITWVSILGPYKSGKTLLVNSALEQPPSRASLEFDVYASANNDFDKGEIANQLLLKLEDKYRDLGIVTDTEEAKLPLPKKISQLVSRGRDIASIEGQESILFLFQPTLSNLQHKHKQSLKGLIREVNEKLASHNDMLGSAGQSLNESRTYFMALYEGWLMPIEPTTVTHGRHPLKRRFSFEISTATDNHTSSRVTGSEKVVLLEPFVPENLDEDDDLKACLRKLGFESPNVHEQALTLTGQHLGLKNLLLEMIELENDRTDSDSPHIRDLQAPTVTRDQASQALKKIIYNYNAAIGGITPYIELVLESAGFRDWTRVASGSLNDEEKDRLIKAGLKTSEWAEGSNGLCGLIHMSIGKLETADTGKVDALHMPVNQAAAIAIAWGKWLEPPDKNGQREWRVAGIYGDLKTALTEVFEELEVGRQDISEWKKEEYDELLQLSIAQLSNKPGIQDIIVEQTQNWLIEILKDWFSDQALNDYWKGEEEWGHMRSRLLQNDYNLKTQIPKELVDEYRREGRLHQLVKDVLDKYAEKTNRMMRHG